MEYYRLEGGHRNAMNIKYRLLCKRLIEEGKRVGVIQYYNVLFIMELLSDKDIWSLEQWVNGMNDLYMKDLVCKNICFLGVSKIIIDHTPDRSFS